ncbi:hypothetical protein H072_5270 [Dactylellina haptotyla CBS 200.50]|uniref:Carboxyphosphonoenolpyruvate phosphonomutase-like protein n=1 Tax=Dactylellina haptotyla (strain CBS 200.50) TaxID=1284197 RepID=S8AI96_DACHA|nr:hypothetical protein H072_5270 [Dactylellina haptotyla CBS 200.50]
MSRLSPLNTLAKTLKALHVPGKPLILTNVHDAAAAKAVASHAASKALATASYSIAMSQGVPDAQLDLAGNLVGIKNIARGIKNAGESENKPLSADLQDGYEDIAETIKSAIALSVVGANIEDLKTDTSTGEEELRTPDDAADRIRVALKAAEEAGVPDFVINARTDVFGYGGTVKDVIERGKKYLDAGATTVFVWGKGKHMITIEEVKEMVEVFGGRLAVQGTTPLGLKELADAGVARISYGPWFALRSWKAFEADAAATLTTLEN